VNRPGSTVKISINGWRRLRIKEMSWRLGKRTWRPRWPKTSWSATTSWSMQKTRQYGPRETTWKRRRQAGVESPQQGCQCGGQDHSGCAAIAKFGQPDATRTRSQKSQEAKVLESSLLAFLVRMGRVPRHKAAAEADSQGTELAGVGPGEAAAAVGASTQHKPNVDGSGDGEPRTAKKASSDTEVENGRERTPLRIRTGRPEGVNGGKQRRQAGV
jgi:hypothetical protein